MFSIEGVQFTLTRGVAQDVTARVRRGVREEMAVARLAAAELAWRDQRKDAEIDAVKQGMKTPSPFPEPVA